MKLAMDWSKITEFSHVVSMVTVKALQSLLVAPVTYYSDRIKQW